MKNKRQEKYVRYASSLMGLATLATLALAVPALAQTTTTPAPGSAWGGHVGFGAGMHGE